MLPTVGNESTVGNNKNCALLKSLDPSLLVLGESSGLCCLLLFHELHVPYILQLTTLLPFYGTLCKFSSTPISVYTHDTLTKVNHSKHGPHFMLHDTKV